MTSRPVVLLVLDKMVRAGTQRHILHLLEGLGRDYTFHVACLEGRGPWDDEVRRRGGRLHVWGLTRLYGPSGWQAVRGLGALIRDLRPAGMETFMFTAHVAGAAAARLGGPVRMISSRREMILWRRPLHFRLRRWANQMVTRHLANSEAVARDVIANEGVDPQTVSVIPNGLEVDLLDRPTSRVHGDGRVHAVVPAALKPVKRHHLMLEALALKREALGNLTVHFVGEGPLENVLRRRTVELDLGDRVVFEGMIDPLLPELKAFDFAALPSKSEGSSNSLIECLGAGLPVVAFDVDGNRECVRPGETGLLIPRDDVSAFAGALSELTRDSRLRETLGPAAAQDVRGRYSVERMCALKSREYGDTFAC